ncbi:MAG TPA: DUF485 domain-containing protein [Spirochaetia bacterium]|nr:DUF485 domain-containing protein [Spirochaetia bacterium]
MHDPATQWKRDNASSLKELLGKWLIIIYAIIYGGFILVNIVSPSFMGIDVGSLNVAIVYGIGLIISAIILAFVYNSISTHAEELFEENSKNENGESK